MRAKNEEELSSVAYATKVFSRKEPRFIRLIEGLILILTPLALVSGFFIPAQFRGLLSLVVVCASLLMFFGLMERQVFRVRVLIPSVVMAALAAAGRMLFAPFPSFKPVSAICIMAGFVFGRRSGFMVGALAALASNFFFGQGPWTPWQMYAWGLVGYLGGCLGEHLFFHRHPSGLYILGIASGYLFGFIMNCWYILAFVQPLTWQGALLALSAAFILDTTHACSTLLFLLLLWRPWRKKLTRIAHKFALKGSDELRVDGGYELQACDIEKPSSS